MTMDPNFVFSKEQLEILWRMYHDGDRLCIFRSDFEKLGWGSYFYWQDNEIDLLVWGETIQELSPLLKTTINVAANMYMLTLRTSGHNFVAELFGYEPRF